MLQEKKYNMKKKRKKHMHSISLKNIYEANAFIQNCNEEEQEKEKKKTVSKLTKIELFSGP